MAERFADGRASDEALSQAHEAAVLAHHEHEEAEAERKARQAKLSVCFGRGGVDSEQPIQADVLRDIIPNPFRPVTLDPAWLQWNGGTIPTLAQAAHEERELPSGHLDPVRLALMADMLEDAGCSDAAILEHLRGPGSHVRGCWAVDLLLGKT